MLICPIFNILVFINYHEEIMFLTVFQGLSSFCVRCGHGGHTTHMRDWFEESEECPTGCGCKCFSYPAEDLKFQQGHTSL